MRIQIFTLLATAIVLVSMASGCSSSNTPSSSRNPSSTRTSKSQYPGGSLPGIVLPGSQATTNGLPPGQAKKLAGEQSAKAFAPGQQKKAQKEAEKRAKKQKKGKKK
ncbi:MAG: hypothetical protein ACO1OQ_14620 [Rufibacter sp.]